MSACNAGRKAFIPIFDGAPGTARTGGQRRPASPYLMRMLGGFLSVIVTQERLPEPQLAVKMAHVEVAMSDQTRATDEPKNEEEDVVVAAIGAILSALRPLDDSARLHVLEFVIKRLGIPIGARPEITQRHAPIAEVEAHPSAPEVRPTAVNDIRSFAAEKSPKKVNDKVALVAYYLAHLAPPSERRDYIVSDDISTYFIQADFPLPTAPPSMTLIHAKNAGYLNALPDRGQYKLNSVGYNLVAHKLPSRETGEARRKPAKRKAPVKKKK